MNRYIPITFLFLLCSLLSHGQDALDDAVVGTVMGGTEKVARKMVSAAFLPFTDYSAGDFLAGGALGYSRIDRVWTEPEVTGSGLTGITLGGGAGYALTDRLAVYAAGDALLVDGKIGTAFYSGHTGDTPSRLNFYMGNVFAGAGFDLVKDMPFSLPLFLGLHCSAYSFRAVLEEVAVSSPVSGTAAGEVHGGGMTPGVSGGLSGEARIGRITLSGYALFMADFTGLTGSSDVTVTLPAGAGTVDFTRSHTSEAFYGSTYGFSLKFSPERRWTLGLDFSDFLPFGETGDEGVQMTTLAVTAGFRAY